ncbi:hypothetical protein ATCC90586_010806 [Pythium insidiosum]|nr:hypothetical protein ATCC90586_010806 [Pythium insidiosum]
MRQRLKAAGDAVARSEAGKRDARADALRHAQRLDALMASRRQALEAHGRHPAEAWLLVSREILTSDDPAIVQQREAWDASNRSVNVREKGVENASRHLHYFQKLHVLMELVVTRRREWIHEKHSRFYRVRQASQDRVSELLFQFVPKLTRVLREYYDFHTICQKRAAIEREAQEVQLREHHEWFGDGTPASTKDIRQKIQEFTGVIHRSTQRMREAVTCQAELWEGKRDLLPVKVFNMIVNEYEMLWSTLNGGGKDMMRDLVAKITDRSDDSMSDDVEVKVEHVPSASSTVSSSASPASVSETSASQVVDLTQDDDNMRGGVQLSRRLEFDTTTTTPTRAAEPTPVAMPIPAPHPAASIPLPPPAEAKDEEMTAADQMDPSPGPSAEDRMHEYAEGDELFAEVINGDEQDPQVCRCWIVQLLPGGNYWVRFEDGDEFAVAPEYLYTVAEVEARGSTKPPPSENSTANEDRSGCVVM